uniref:Uncharacterized protein n=1 Tax=Arundo donax TaxID=35708 RepID=A0A0A9QLW7_ARUDO
MMAVVETDDEPISHLPFMPLKTTVKGHSVSQFST